MASRERAGAESESRNESHSGKSASRAQAEQEPKEALFKRVNRKEERKETRSEDLEVHGISVDDS